MKAELYGLVQMKPYLVSVDRIEAVNHVEKKHQVNGLLQQLPVWLNEIGMNETKQPPVFINTIGGLGSPWWFNNIKAKFIVPEFIESHHSFSMVEADLAATDLAMQAVAIIESIVFMVCINLELMQSEQPLTRLRLSGGLSQLDGLCQDLANLSGLQIERMKLPEATARGAAWLAAGKPDSWSNIEIDIFKPAVIPALAKRYAMFQTTLPY